MQQVPEDSVEAVDFFQSSIEKINNEVGKVIIGQKSVLDKLLICLFSRGHCILIGVPGLAKTLLIKTLSQTLNLDFSRIQFTPDLMPGDITGTEVIEKDRSTGQNTFKFVKGPVFANIVLADEINRTPPKTQAALLQGMEEFNVTAGGTTYPLDDPFFVLATQNPIEQEGTYPLPEAQLDRFMFNLWLDYPSVDEEQQIVSQPTDLDEVDIQQVLNAEQVIKLQDLVKEVPVPKGVLASAVELVTKTRPQSEIAPNFISKYMSWGAGPRASQYLVLGSQARALSRGRYNVTKEDLKALAKPVLRHRVVNNYAAEAEGLSADDLIDKLLDEM